MSIQTSVDKFGHQVVHGAINKFGGTAPIKCSNCIDCKEKDNIIHKLQNKINKLEKSLNEYSIFIGKIESQIDEFKEINKSQ